MAFGIGAVEAVLLIALVLVLAALIAVIAILVRRPGSVRVSAAVSAADIEEADARRAELEGQARRQGEATAAALRERAEVDALERRRRLDVELAEMRDRVAAEADDLRRRLNSGEFAGTPGQIDGLGVGNLEPKLRRILDRAEGGDSTAAATVQAFMAELS